MMNLRTNPVPVESRISPRARTQGRKASTRHLCNLCNATFRSNLPHQLFCESCRNGDETLRYSEWLPGCI